ncbi:MAG: transporter [Myxococcales bacterium]|nr:transporter [Myxococcales bacterium]
MSSLKQLVASLFHESPLLLLFTVSSIGFLVGRVRVSGFSLGVAAVLFVGLGVGALDPALRLPEIVQQLGLAIFVYTIGIGSGAGFFTSLRRRGLRDLAIVAGSISLAALLAVAIGRGLGLDAASIAGLFSGSLTNTPALASVVELLGHTGASEAAKSAPVVAYSLAYPSSVLVVLLVLFFARRLPILEPTPSRRPPAGELVGATVRIKPGVSGTATALAHTSGYNVVFSRHKRGGRMTVVSEDTLLEPDDLVSVVGLERDVHAAVAALGVESPERLDLDRTVLDFRRVFVSRPAACSVPLHDLDLVRRFGAVVTRVRRGDVDILPSAETELELGDRVRVVAPRERLGAVAKFLGDSYRALAEIDVLTFGLGIAVGLVLGAVSVPVPGGGAFKLGLAGGPLVVGLVLGRVGRTGPLFWTLPFSANLTLRQLGLVLFLAGVGTRSGDAFASKLLAGQGGGMLVAGGLIALASAGSVVAIGRLLKMPTDLLGGMVSGIQTQPAALAFVAERSSTDQANVGYASVFPLATITKIVVAQLLFAWLR